MAGNEKHLLLSALRQVRDEMPDCTEKTIISHAIRALTIQEYPSALIDEVAPEATENQLPGGSNPSQYGLPPNAKDLQDLIEYRNMNFAVGNILKAAYRLGTCAHSDPARDLRKIIFFAERELARIGEPS